MTEHNNNPTAIIVNTTKEYFNDTISKKKGLTVTKWTTDGLMRA